MKRLPLLLVYGIILAMIAAGCSSTKENLTLDKKHKPFPDYVLNSSQKVQETYIMASNYPDVLAQVQCFCGCAADGHKSNLNCFVQDMGPGNAVQAWDPHGIT